MQVSWAASLQRNLSFLSPRTWQGIHYALSNQIPNSASTFKLIRSWLYHILIPFLLLTTVIHHPIGSYRKPLGKSALQAAINTLLAPLTIMKTYETMPLIKTTANRLYIWKAFRQEANQEAIDILSRDLSIGKATRTPTFDVYFPLRQDKLAKMNGQSQRAMLFIPGFLIDHTSYSSIASRIASEGDIVVVVLSLEPLRMADKFFVEMIELKRCIRLTTKLWNLKCGVKNHISTLEWSLGGHSYGGYAAMRLAPHLAEHFNKSSTDKLKVVVWAAGDRENFLTDLSPRHDTSIFVLLGIDDTMCKFDEHKREVLESYLPSDVRIQNVQGSHHNFASYSDNETNGISRDEQHRQVSNATIDFLKKDCSKIPITVSSDN